MGFLSPLDWDTSELRRVAELGRDFFSDVELRRADLGLSAPASSSCENKKKTINLFAGVDRCLAQWWNRARDSVDVASRPAGKMLVSL